jgi:hypothetical protein
MKPVYVKPALYCMFYEHLKQIAQEYGYNLVVNGSMNRDLDLIAIPWVDNPKSEQDMIKDFQKYLTGRIITGTDGLVHYTTLPGNRHSYVIDLNRGDKHGEWVRFADEEYYLDISVVQLTLKTMKDKDKDLLLIGKHKPHCWGKMTWILKYSEGKEPFYSVCRCEHGAKECMRLTREQQLKSEGGKPDKWADKIRQIEEIRDAQQKAYDEDTKRWDSLHRVRNALVLTKVESYIEGLTEALTILKS